uniref:TRAP transporter large permease n=1 Tax=Pseudactinotalea sp. TaxID=1926260 RepID=UPI003B3B7241
MTTAVVLAIIIAVFLIAAALRVPIAFALVLGTLPFMLLDPRMNLELITQRMYAGLDSFVLLAVPFFILAASIMVASGVTDRLIELASALVGWIRGGLGIVNVGVSIGFSGMSGSSTADVAGTGTVLIPQMVKRGYPAGFAVGVTAASAVISSVIPPSIQLIVWGSLTNTSIGDLFLAGIVPGVMIGGGMMLVAWLVARRQNLPREGRFEGTRVRKALVGA